mgnify:FL=1
MNGIDRTQAPATRPFGRLQLPQPAGENLDNGIELYVIDKGDQEVCRIDLLFDGGRCPALTPAIADLTGPMIRRGVPGYDANRIAELLDYYGAWIQTGTTMHFSTLSVFSLNRNLSQVLPLVADIINKPLFPDDDLDLLRQQRIDRLHINRSKVRFVAGELFNQLVFGKNHPYARTIEADDISAINRQDLQEYHRKYYLGTRIRAIASGCITKETANTVRQFLCSIACHDMCHNLPAVPLQPETEHFAAVDLPGTLQTGIRMGMPVAGCLHPDFPFLSMANLILGGYFGSRLMKNIREEKGYTYGISSHIISLQNSAYFTIITETGTDYTQPLIEETRREMQTLCEKEVPADELETARNYLQGQRARTLDSPFAMGDYYLSSMISNTPFDYFERKDEAIRHATAADIQRAAQLYLRPEMLYVALAGDKATESI